MGSEGRLCGVSFVGGTTDSWAGGDGIGGLPFPGKNGNPLSSQTALKKDKKERFL